MIPLAFSVPHIHCAEQEMSAIAGEKLKKIAVRVRVHQVAAHLRGISIEK